MSTREFWIAWCAFVVGGLFALLLAALAGAQ